MNKRRIIWFTLTVLVVFLFLKGIPVDVYERHEFLYSLLGAALFFVCLFMALGDYQSLYELTEKPEEGVQEDGLRKASPFAVIPAIIMIFVFVMSHSSRVSDEIKEHAVLTKALVTGGQSSSSTRRGRTTTTYDINVTYKDSTDKIYKAELDVSGSEFNDLYEGATIDIVYSSKYPSLAKPVLGLEELSKYKKIPMGNVGVENMIAILEGKVKPDSIAAYLNGICYEWHENEDGDGYYINDQKKIAVAVALEEGRVLYIRETKALVVDMEQLFAKSAEAYGFKKREINDGEKTMMEYYTDDYLITRELRKSETQSDDFLNQPAFEVFSVFRKE